MKTTYALILSAFLLTACGDDAPISPDGGLADASTADAGESLFPLRGTRLAGAPCPDGETCDARTTGINLSGSWDNGGRLASTALGGVQYISIATQGVDVDFTLSSNDESIFTVEQQIEAVDGIFAALLGRPEGTMFAQAHIRGTGEGEALLEIRAMETGDLIDRVTITVRAGEPAEIETATQVTDGVLGSSRRFCFHTDFSAELLVDREMSVSSEARTQPDELFFCFLVADTASGPIPVTVTYGGEEYTREVPDV